MPNLSKVLTTLSAVDANCGISSSITVGSTTYACDKSVFMELTLARKIKGYLFSVIITGAMSPRPNIGDKITWGSRTMVVSEVDEADTETRLHLSKYYGDDA
jgi:hypothetical protein